jgi:hypothetical protein
MFALTALPAAAQKTVSQHVPLFGDTILEVEVDIGGARFLPIVASTEEDVTVTAAGGDGAPTALPLQTTRVGKRVIVTLGRGAGSSTIPFVAKAQSAYEISYPARMKLIVHAFGGDIDIVKPSTAVTVTAADGAVLIENPDGPVSVDDQSGSVTVHQARAALDLAADAGDVTADLAPTWLSRPIRMQSAAGNLRLTVPASFSAHVDASSQNGSVNDQLSHAATSASGPPVWLYAEHGDVTIGLPPS